MSALLSTKKRSLRRSPASCVKVGVLAGFVSLLLLGVVPLKAQAQPLNADAARMIEKYPQSLDMAGYVLGRETNLNQIYIRRLAPGMWPGDQKQEEPVIFYEKKPFTDGQNPPSLLNIEKQWPPLVSPGH